MQLINEWDRKKEKRSLMAQNKRHMTMFRVHADYIDLIRDIKFVKNLSTNVKVDTSTPLWFTNSIMIITKGIDFEFVLTELAGPIHRLFGIDWKKFNVDGDDKFFRLESNKIRYSKKFYRAFTIIVKVYEEEMASCKMKPVTSVRSEVQKIITKDWHLECGNGEG